MKDSFQTCLQELPAWEALLLVPAPLAMPLKQTEQPSKSAEDTHLLFPIMKELGYFGVSFIKIQIYI